MTDPTDKAQNPESTPIATATLLEVSPRMVTSAGISTSMTSRSSDEIEKSTGSRYESLFSF